MMKAVLLTVIALLIVVQLNQLGKAGQAFRRLGDGARHANDFHDELLLQASSMNNASRLSPIMCQCVHCQEDPFCGKLYVGTQLKYPYSHFPPNAAAVGNGIRQTRIHIIVSHCHVDLEFLSTLIHEFTNIASIHIISKCGQEVKRAPAFATVERLPNIGRCDHTYAYYIANVLGKSVPANDNDIVVFMKDTGLNNDFLHQPGDWNSLQNMIRLAAYGMDRFACGIVPKPTGAFRKNWILSAYHDFDELGNFTMKKYDGMTQNNQSDFDSPYYPNLRSFFNDLAVKSSVNAPGLVRVCYGGVFAAPVKNIRQHSTEMWQAMEQGLARGDNIIEGHYAERMWGLLLSKPLEPNQAQAVRDYSNYLVTMEHPVLYPHAGMLLTMPQMHWMEKILSDYHIIY
jgi:hypothetical protein